MLVTSEDWGVNAKDHTAGTNFGVVKNDCLGSGVGWGGGGVVGSW